jgi:hypothetical protein
MPSESSPLLPILARLDEVLQEETEALRRQDTAELAQFFQRKSQGLLELANAQRSLGNAPIGEAARAALASVRRSLEVNRDVLKLHLDAASELIDVFSQAIRDSESDGTYDPSYGLRGRR